MGKSLTSRQRKWVWPLRSGLMTVLVVTGLSVWMTSGCGGRSESPLEPGSGGRASTGGVTNHLGGSTLGGASVAAGGMTPIPLGGTTSGCVLDGVGGGIFSDQVFSAYTPERVVYSWTTPEQVAELRNGGPLFSRNERPNLGRGNALDALEVLAAQTDANGKLAGILSQQLFAKARYAWTNPWATRMGWPGEQYGNQLIRVELLDTAWTVVFDGSYLSVMDEMGQYVTPEAALLSPERIGAIVFTRSYAAGGPECSTFGGALTSSFGAIGGSGYREIVLGNLAMVKQWSLGTSVIADRINSDIAKLTTFKAAVEQCAVIPYDPYWNANVTCSWEYGRLLAPSDYTQALAMPNDYYQPTSAAIGAIIDTLRADGFTVNPYVVDVK